MDSPPHNQSIDWQDEKEHGTHPPTSTSTTSSSGGHHHHPHHVKPKKEEIYLNHNNSKYPIKEFSVGNSTYLPEKRRLQPIENTCLNCGKILVLQNKDYLMCSLCNHACHIGCLDTYPEKSKEIPLAGDWSYLYKCKKCATIDNPISPKDNFYRTLKSWMEIVHLALWNLITQQRNRDKENEMKEKEREKRERERELLFGISKNPDVKTEEHTTNQENLKSTGYVRWKEELCVFIDNNWDTLCTGKARTQTWNNTIGSALSSHQNLFKNGIETLGHNGWWGLKDEDDPIIVKGKMKGKEKEFAEKKEPKHHKANSSDVTANENDLIMNKIPKKKKLVTLDQESANQNAASESKERKLLKRKEREEKKSKRDMALGNSANNPDKEKKKKVVIAPPPVISSRPLFYRPLNRYKRVMIAKENSAPQMKISEDCMSVFNDKGYRMARASHGIREGGWYYEITLTHNRESALAFTHAQNNQNNSSNQLTSSASNNSGPHSRIGWSTEKGDVQGPVGYDYFSYSYRDVDGAVFHQSRSKQYGSAYFPGDVIGVYIYLPPSSLAIPGTAPMEQIPGTTSTAKETEPAILPGSSISFFINGEPQGTAFKDIYLGTYYPAASLYMAASAKFNFGPHFKFAPPPQLDYSPFAEAVKIQIQLSPERTATPANPPQPTNAEDLPMNEADTASPNNNNNVEDDENEDEGPNNDVDDESDGMESSPW